MTLSVISLILSWTFAVSGSLAELDVPLGNNNETFSAQTELRQYTCGTASPVFVNVGLQGRFASPNYPYSYSVGSDCRWILTTSTNARFNLICDPFSISCSGDYFMYSPSGDDLFGDARQVTCGSGSFQLTSDANSIAVTFHSSTYTTGGGFSCVAQAIATTTTTTQATTTTTTKPSSCQCGIKGQNRVVGGQSAGVTEWPWQTFLEDRNFAGKPYQYCGATLISPSWVITAAHCTFNRLASTIGVVVGQYNTSGASSTTQVRSVVQIIQHPSFDRATVNNDIALLKLSSPVTLSGAVRPACLPTRFVNYDFNQQIGVVTGWGTTSFGGASSQTLMEVAVPIISTANCKRNQNVGPKITDNMFCTYADYRDACQGDSGGPLNWVDPQTGLGYLIGITSWGIGCAKLNTPGVYTKVTNYLPWIQQYTGTLCSM